MTAILVTGGAGFIGSHTCKALAADGLTPVAFDNLSRGHAELVRWGPLVHGDILEPAALDAASKLYQPKCVVHFAALAYVGELIFQPLSYYKCNVTGLINVLDAMVRNGADTIVLSSSCATYGVPDTIPIPETAPQRPINPYGQSKLFASRSSTMLRSLMASAPQYFDTSTLAGRTPTASSRSAMIPRLT